MLSKAEFPGKTEEPALGNSTELRKIVHDVLLTQIQFGAYRCGEKLPTIEETGARLHVSADTVRTAYRKLKEEGYISLSKNVGAAVRADYDGREAEAFIQTFFARRKDAMLDLSNSLLPLFGNAQWIGLKNASEETMGAMASLLVGEPASAPYAMLDYLNHKYSALGNDIFMRLVWQIFMFLQAPFFSVKENLQYFDRSAEHLPEVLALCQKEDWPGLRAEMDGSMERLSAALDQFYRCRIVPSPPGGQTAFVWSSYKKSRQLCYSLAMELLVSISRGVYPPGSLLPSQTELARQKNVSLSTVRRALELLGGVGAIKSAKYAGTRVLPLDRATENSDFTKPALQRRLLDMAESTQVFALSCREVSLLTLSSLDAVSAGELCGALKGHKRWRRGETLPYFILDLLARHAPYQAIRTVYSELLRQHFWGYALRGMKGSQEAINARYDPFFDKLIGALEKVDHARFAVHLEELMLHELREAVDLLSRLGIAGVDRIFVPKENGI